MKIKVGGLYRTRNGERVEIFEKDGDDTYPFNDIDGGCYTPEGNVWTTSESDNDLVALWNEEHTHVPSTYTMILEALLGPDVVKIAKRLAEALDDA